MNNLDKVIGLIKKESKRECEDIIKKTVAECGNIRNKYAQEEKDEYWKYLSKATSEAEQRLIKLGELADSEAKKKLLSTRREMAEIAFELAAKKLSRLPKDEFNLLLKRLKLKPGFTPEAVVSRYKELLQPTVEAILFD